MIIIAFSKLPRLSASHITAPRRRACSVLIKYGRCFTPKFVLANFKKIFETVASFNMIII